MFFIQAFGGYINRMQDEILYVFNRNKDQTFMKFDAQNFKAMNFFFNWGTLFLLVDEKKFKKRVQKTFVSETPYCTQLRLIVLSKEVF